MNRYKGFPYPIERTVQGLFQSGTDISQIKASMLAIIMTKPGERVFRPQFGTPLHRLVGQSDALIVEQARHMIASGIKKWEKRVQVLDIHCQVIDNIARRDLSVVIIFVDPMNMQQQHELRMQFPLEGE